MALDLGFSPGNRRLLDRVLLPFEANAPACMAVLDIDQFKQVNDRFGHAVGDAVLRELAALLRRCLQICSAQI